MTDDSAGLRPDSHALAGQGYGATLWEPDAETVANARISRYMRWLADRGVQSRREPGLPRPLGVVGR